MMNAEDYYWIGVIKPEDAKQTVAFITPLTFFYEGKWQPVDPTACRELFPNNGKATIFAKDFPNFLTEYLWMFQPKRSDLIEDKPKNSYYIVYEKPELAPLAQIFNWTTKVNHIFDMPELLEKGIAAEYCFCQQIYIQFQSYLY